MANFLKLESREAIQARSLPQPSEDADLHISVIHGPEVKSEYFSDPEILEDKNLTIVEVPSGEFGCGPSIYEYINSPGMLLVFSAVVSIGAGFLNRIGEVFADKLITKFAGQTAPSTIHLEYPSLNATIKIIVPENINENQTRALNKLVSIQARKLKRGTYGELFFHPEANTLVPIYWREGE